VPRCSSQQRRRPLEESPVAQENLWDGRLFDEDNIGGKKLFIVGHPQRPTDG
jgi:hypothetical protein